MEPPAKRMRILQSIGVDEVDERNPEYIKGKQQNSEWLKNKWDTIYAKYGAMSDMMSDEVDMRGNGSVVVDRGHMRKLDKAYRNRLGRRRAIMPEDDTQLVDDMFANDEEMGIDEEEEEDYDERDELAPSQSPEPVLLKSNTLSDGIAADHHISPIARSSGQADIPVPNTPTNAALQATLAASANPAADLIQLVQFPQTPAGQQARRAFEMQTAQAVQQAVASIFSSLLSNVPTLQSPQLNVLQAPTMETTELAPATTPSLFRPPPSVVADLPTATRSSPVPLVQGERRKRRSFAVGVHIKARPHNSTGEILPLPLSDDTTHGTEEPAIESSVDDVLIMDQPTIPSSLERIKGSRKAHNKKLMFTAEDDQYIIESRVLHKRTWREIMNSRPQWINRKPSTFWWRWCNTLRERAAEMERSGELGSPGTRKDVVNEPEELPSLNKRQRAQPQSSPAAARHLPTPSSLFQEEERNQNDELNSENPDGIIASGGHFDDDEKDLLSLCGDTGPLCHVHPLGGDTDEDLDDTREIPETPMNLTQESSIQAVLQGTATREATVDATIPSDPQQTKRSPKRKCTRETIPAASTVTQAAITKTNGTRTRTQTSPANRPAIAFTPSSKKQSSHKPKLNTPYRIDSDLDLANTFTPLPSTSHPCPLCKQTFPTPALLHTHTAQPHPKEIHIRASSALPPLSQDDQNDDLHPKAPSTPLVAIKREPRDEEDADDDAAVLDPPTNFLVATPQRTEAEADSHLQSSSAAPKSTGKLSRSAYNQVKRSWARRGTPSAKKRQRPRPSLGKVGVSRTRFWDEGGEGSEDELAM